MTVYTKELLTIEQLLSEAKSLLFTQHNLAKVMDTICWAEIEIADLKRQIEVFEKLFASPSSAPPATPPA